jgi:predicted DsbA family dithiol-disulfide isomerase
VRLASRMALESERVRAEAVDAVHFRSLAGLYQVSAVPRIVFNRRVHVVGAVPEPAFLRSLLEAAASG